MRKRMRKRLGRNEMTQEENVALKLAIEDRIEMLSSVVSRIEKTHENRNAIDANIDYFKKQVKLLNNAKKKLTL